MAKRLFVIVAVLVVTGLSLVIGQSKPSIQGVWRPVELTVISSNPPPGLFPRGTHANLQPGLLIFTGKHYATLTDTGVKPRPATPFKVASKPTAEEMQSQWGPFAANAGTYELSGTALTRHVMVAKNSALQNGRALTRSTIKLDGNNLWITTTENAAGKVADPNTIKYVRVE